ncbi:unnamed protein product [Trifolium pratense]|uniref:Uncharacterized protein n=1 Tax=Trifolium pratense TaxID=57577 RepID=A0ACB0K563_TRIPR|nr:unnamed protein product [Trifolium pratense]
MAEAPQERPLRSYAIPSQEEPHNSIAAPAIEANNFELKPSLLSAVQQNQFSGNPTDDPNLHLSIFLQYADTVKANGVSPEAIRLRLFPFSLRDKARAWLQSLPSNSVATWNELKKVFLARYFPPSKTAMLRAQINGFRQRDNESLFEAWERYKEMIRICPHHGLENWLIIHTFYNGLLYNTRMTIDAAAGGALMDKPYNQAYQLIESMAQNHYQWGNERTTVEKPQTKGGMYEISNMDHINAKLDALTQKIESLTNAPKATVAATIQNCELCGAQSHIITECRLLTEAPTDQVNYTQGNSYNQNQRNHPYLSYNSNNALYAPSQAPTPSPPGFQKPAQNAPMKSNLELMMENFIAVQTQTNKEFLNQNIHTNEQIKQLTSRLDPQPNPRGHVNAVILRSGTQYDGPADPRTKNPAMQPNSDKTTEKESEPKEKEDSGEETKEKEKPYVPPPPYKPPIPYPQRLVQSKNVGQFNKFVELLQKLNITIPFTEAITQMPSYAKFLKDILTNKRKIEDDETVMLTAECSAILQNEMPPKLKDPGSFSIPCVIGKYVIDRALCDLGASISLMPVALCEKLKMGELVPTKMSVQFADRSVKYPLGSSSSSRQNTIDDVLHEIRAQNALNQERDGLFYAMHQQQEEMMERMTFMQAQQNQILQNQHEMQGYYHRWESSEEHRQQQLDNVIQELGGLVLNMEEIKESPIILGQTILTIGDVVIEVHKGKVNLRCGKEDDVLKALNSVENFSHFISSYFDNVVIHNSFSDLRMQDSLEKFPILQDPSIMVDIVKIKISLYFEAHPPHRKRKNNVNHMVRKLRRGNALKVKFALGEPPD